LFANVRGIFMAKVRTVRSESIIKILKERLEGLFPDRVAVGDFDVERSTSEFRIFWHELIGRRKGIVSSMDCKDGRCEVSLIVDHATDEEIEELKKLENLIEDMYKGVSCEINTGLIAGGASIVCYGGLEDLEPVYMDIIDHAYKLVERYR